ncbi:Uncharacterized protein Adt_39515 [Abeliophyllum distichum]|uniref:Uncharacterized protein n=1 Tax=Abeliophyllum distichum TaxID=126358 RepID=A0ABD1Q5A0_9LAMI
MASKRPWRKRPPSPSSKEETPPTENWIDKCPIQISKNVDLAFFTFDASSFHVEEYFLTMGWVSILTLDEKAYPNIMKGHVDEVNHFDVFLLDSILVGQKLDFPYIMLHHMNTVHHGHRPTALPYGMILTEIFQHFKVSFCDEVVLSPKPTDTINIRTLRRMKIVKEDGQWVEKSKGFDDESGSSTLPFEGGEEIDEDEDDPLLRPRSHRLSSSTLIPQRHYEVPFEDHFNLLNGWIDLLTSSLSFEI